MLPAYLYAVALTALVMLGPVGKAVATDGPPPNEDLAAEDCARKIDLLFPPNVIPVKELALDRVTLEQRTHMVMVPLKNPRGILQAVRWFEKDTAAALESVRLLQAGKIGSMRVQPFVHAPADVYVLRGARKEDVQTCDNKELIEKVLGGRCKECEVIEWLSLKP